MTTTHCFTSVTVNYLAKARAMAESVKQHHPDWVVHLLLCDSVPSWFDLDSEPFDHLIRLEDLGIDRLPGWVFQHSVVEICTAAKAPTLAHLLDSGADQVVYLDPDVIVFSPLDEVTAALEEHAIVVIPHQSEPETSRSAVIDNEICSLIHGVFNLGFIAVANRGDGIRFARWWRDRLLEFCFDEPERGLFTDQRWCDLIPAYFTDYMVLRSPGYNVATWNLTHREVELTEDGSLEVNGEPLAFYHFTGYDAGAGRIMLNKYAPHGSPLFNLWDWYEAALGELEQGLIGQFPWAYSTFTNGDPILPAMRRLYRDRIDLQREFPDPFDVPEERSSFLQWWRSEQLDDQPRP